MLTDSNEKTVFAMNPLALAYLGDAVWEAFVRRRIMQTMSFGNNADKLHHEGVHYVNAGAQAHMIHRLFDRLSESEQALVKRARNHRTATKAKNADPVDYKWATGFEALLGALELSGQSERLAEIMEASAELVETHFSKETEE
ncbi:MAG: ribonuclease III [Firmicutes bacterium]|nr:ribonuclease III [Bacillota bacterium]